MKVLGLLAFLILLIGLLCALKTGSYEDNQSGYD